MSDIVERLRKDKWHVSAVECEEAAQEIERLREELGQCGKDNCIGRKSEGLTSWCTVSAKEAAVAAERERCARIAMTGCLVPPDGGSPTDSEREMCDHIAERIRKGDAS